MLSPEEILKLPDAARRNLKLLQKPKSGRRSTSSRRGDHPRTASRPRRKRIPTREEVISYVKAHNIHKLSEWVDDGDENSPRPRDVERYFENWTEAKLTIWGPPLWMQMVSPSYFLKCVSEFGIWSEDAYLKAMRAQPDIIPPKREVLLYWGSFRNLFECARRNDLKTCIAEYAKFVMSRGGKFPSPAELQSRGLRIGPGVKVFGSKAKFDEFVESYIKGRAI